MAEATKTSCATAKRLFKRAENALHQELEASALEETVRRRFEDYRKRWNTVQELHDEFIEGLGEIADEEVDVHEQWINELSERFYNLEMRVDTDLHERKKCEIGEERSLKQEVAKEVAREVASAKSGAVELKPNNIQLERMKFAKFDGDIRKYPKFKDEFQTHIRPLCQLCQG